YVDLNSVNPSPPYSDWTSAATNIQDAVDASTNGDFIRVSDGIYQVGFRTDFSPPPIGQVETNRLLVGKPIAIQSLNGPTTTIVDGGGIYRCVNLTNGA